MTSDIRINAQRLWQSLMRMAEIGATKNGGSNRQALTEDDRIGRELFIRWCQAEGCKITIDKMGNIFARYSGLDKDAASVLIGSHLDTQPTGGKFDGVYGVLAGLEVIRTLNENNIKLQHPIDIAVWTNEEGARFSPAMIGSGVFADVFSLEYGHTRADKGGMTIGQALKEIDFLGEADCRPFPIKSAFEVHIEQGPVLEANNKLVGVVTGVQGIAWYKIIIDGIPAHAGTTPMSMRTDPMPALASIISEIYKFIENIDNLAKVTFGDISLSPGSTNTIPEQVILTVDLRHPDPQTLDKMDGLLKQVAEEQLAVHKLTGRVEDEWKSPPISFDETCINAVENAAKSLNIDYQNIVSGAGHDSVYISKVAPTAMIFIPCKDGLSHNEAEYSKPEEIEAGCNVLLHATLQMAL